MKKILLGSMIALLTVCAHAEYLYWSVDSTTTVGGQSTSGYNYAVLYDYYNGTKTELATKSIVVDDYADLKGHAGEGHYYYIELINYQESTATLIGSSYNDMVPYTALSTSLWNGSEIAKASVVAFTGGNFSPTPEPTSGLLLLMGFAMLGLKRKKEV